MTLVLAPLLHRPAIAFLVLAAVAGCGSGILRQVDDADVQVA